MIIIDLLALSLAALEHRSAIEALKRSLSANGALSRHSTLARVATWRPDRRTWAIGDGFGTAPGLNLMSLVMMEAAKYSAVERLRDGRQIEIRALQPADEKDMLAAVDRTSAQSLYHRFFGAKRHFSESEKAFFLNVDFVKHVALVAVANDAGRSVIVGGGRYVVVQPGTEGRAVGAMEERAKCCGHHGPLRTKGLYPDNLLKSKAERDSPWSRWIMRFDLSDDEWALLEPLMPKSRKSARADDRKIMNAIFYVLRTGMPWRDLPERYGPYTTAYNRFNRWSRRGIWKRIFDALASKSRDSLYLIDSTIVKAHRAASGAKGGSKIRRSASAAVGAPRKFTRSSIARAVH